jgi:hypothetical protein
MISLVNFSGMCTGKLALNEDVESSRVGVL